MACLLSFVVRVAQRLLLLILLHPLPVGET